MKFQKRIWALLSLLFFWGLIMIFSRQPIWVEKYYSSLIYPPASALLRILFGLFPFSIGDLMYFMLIIFILWLIIKRLRKDKSNFTKQREVKGKVLLLITLGLFIYLIFQLFWGLNYVRPGIEERMGLKPVWNNKQGLEKINHLLLERVNTSRKLIPEKRIDFSKSEKLFDTAEMAYRQYSKNHEFLQYRHASVKSSLWGWLGNYAGFSGYYNPFTGEAQVNTEIPDFLQPFVTCHEMAHQLGYAKEMDANFAAFLVCRESESPRFRYSAYLEMFLYANNSYYQTDSLKAAEITKSLYPSVKDDLNLLAKFNQDHRSFLEPVFNRIFDWFLKSQNQRKGIKSYHQVTAFLIAFYEKYGDL